MKKRTEIVVIVASLCVANFCARPGNGQAIPRANTRATTVDPTGWSPIVLPTGPYRQQIKTMPIEHRPGRLFHVYGNAMRMIDQASKGDSVRPLRQLVLGTTRLRGIRGRQ
ncbi:MAG: hypothetical protein AAF802_27015 [Planctomycetota bacterium]